MKIWLQACNHWITGDGEAILKLYWELKLMQGMSSPFSHITLDCTVY